MSNEAKTLDEQSRKLLKNAEEQIGDLLKVLEDQDAQIWAYLIGGVVALLAGLIAAYFYTQMARERRKTRFDKIKDALRGGINR